MYRAFWLKTEVSLLALALSFSSLSVADEPEPKGEEYHDEGEEAVEQVLVKGVRRSLSEAADRKRESGQFLDAIVAEDIGKMPDTNVAESLQRVSGVQIRRSGGEGSSVAIRGLRQNRIEINGRTYVSPYGRGVDNSTAGGGNQNVLRYLPPEVIRSLEVTKLLSSDQIEGSLGGTINVITRKPLDDTDIIRTLSFEASQQDLIDKASHKTSFMYSNAFMDDTVGLMFGGIIGTKETQEDKFWNFGGWVPMIGIDPNGDGRDAYRMSDLRYQFLQDKRDDRAFNMMLQWQPGEENELYFEYLNTHSETNNYRDWVSAPTSQDLKDYGNSTVFSESDSLLSGSLRSPIQGNVVRAQFEPKTDLFAFGGSTRLGERLSFSGEVSYSKAQLKEGQQFLRAQTEDAYPIEFDFRQGDFASLALPENIDFTDPSRYQYTIGFDRLFQFKTDETAIKLDFDYDLDNGFWETIEMGFRWSSMLSSKDFLDQVFRPGTNAADASVDRLALAIKRPGLLGDASGVSFPHSYLIGDVAGGPGFCRHYSPGCPGPEHSPERFYEVKDTVTSTYLKANYTTTLGEYFATGNVGIRAANTKTVVSNTATVVDDTGAAFIPQSVDTSYTDFLPSAVGIIELDDETLLRMGFSQVVARPDTRDLAVALEVDTKEFSATAGNPELEPYRASQYDVSMEWYFESGSAFSAGIFYKDVESFIVTETTQETLPGFGETTYLVTRQRNGEGGEVSGLELAYQQPLSFLPEPFSGLGVLFNYSYIDSKTDIINSRSGEELPLIGLSENNINLITYYENDYLSTRIAYNWRDEFVDRIGAGGAAVFTESFSSLDYSLRLNISEIFSLDFEAINVLGDPDEKYVGTPDARWIYADTGTRYTLGVSARF